MHPTTIVWWASLAALVIVLVLAGMQILRALREVKRLGTRIAAFEDLPVMAAIRKAEVDLGRLEHALEQVEPLLARAAAAIAIIRRGPFPPELRAAFRRFRADIVAFRTAARR